MTNQAVAVIDEISAVTPNRATGANHRILSSRRW